MFEEVDQLDDLAPRLRDAAADAGHRAVQPDFAGIMRRGRRRRAGRVAAAGALGLVLVAVGVPVVMHRAVDASPSAPFSAQTADDPVLRPLRTTVPVLAWRLKPGTPTKNEYAVGIKSAIFTALSGERGFSYTANIRTVFPEAPVDWPGALMDQSATVAQLTQAAANVRKLDGVQDVKVVEMPGMWFTVSAKVTADDGSVPVIDMTDLPRILDGAGSTKPDGKGRYVKVVRATYSGPGVDRRQYDRILTRTGAAVGLSPSQVTVTPESLTSKPSPSPS